MLYFIRTDNQSFIPPNLVHKTSKINKDHTLYLLDNWAVHTTESGCMDRYNFSKLLQCLLIYLA